MRHTCAPALIAGLFLMSLAGLWGAQDFASQGVLEGTVVDASGAVLPGATVAISGPVSRAERTGPTGSFRISGLPPGSYNVTASHPRFASAEASGLEVKPGEGTRLTLKLSVTIDETVVVTATRNWSSRFRTPRFR